MGFSAFPDGSGGSKGSSHPHLTLDPDRKHHRRLAAPVPNHFHTVEGMLIFIPEKSSLFFPDKTLIPPSRVLSWDSSHASREERMKTTRTEPCTCIYDHKVIASSQAHRQSWKRTWYNQRRDFQDQRTFRGSNKKHYPLTRVGSTCVKLKQTVLIHFLYLINRLSGLTSHSCLSYSFVLKINLLKMCSTVLNLFSLYVKELDFNKILYIHTKEHTRRLLCYELVAVELMYDSRMKMVSSTWFSAESNLEEK